MRVSSAKRVSAAVAVGLFALFAPTPSDGWFVPIEGGRFVRDRDPSIAIDSDRAGGVILASNLVSVDGLQPAPLTVLRLAPGGEQLWRTVLADTDGELVTHGWAQSLIVDEAGDRVYVSALLYRYDPLVFFATIAVIDVATGGVVWQRRVGEFDAGASERLPIAVAPDGSVFTAFVERLPNTLIVEKLAADTGALLWHADHGRARLWVAVSADDEGNVLVASESGDVAYVIKIDGSDGSASWRYEDGSAGVPRIGARGNLFYAGAVLPSDPMVPLLSELDPSDGRPIWRAHLEPGPYVAAETVKVAVAPSGTPVTLGRLVRLIDDDRYENRFGVIAFDADTGAQRWQYLLPEESAGRDIAIDANGDIIVAGTADNGLGVFRRDFFVTKIDHELGEAVWRYTVASLGGGWAEQVSLVDGASPVVAGTVVERTTGCGADSELVAVRLRGETGGLFAPAISPTPRPSGECTDHILYVTSASEPLDGESPSQGRLALIDGLTLAPLASIEVGEQPTQVVVDPKRSLAYVVDPSSAGDGIGRVFEIDVARREIVAVVEVGIRSASIAIARDGEKLYVSNSGSASVSVLATGPLRALGVIEDVDSPVAVAANDSRGEIYVVTEGGALHVVDSETDRVVGSVQVAEAAHSVSVAPNGETIYVSGAYPDRSIFSVDTATLEVTGQACCPSTDFWAGATGFSDDGSTAILAHDDGASPLVLDIASGEFDSVDVDCSVAVDDQLQWNGVGSVAVRGVRGYAGPYAVDLPSRTVVGQIEPNDLRGRPLGVAVGPCVDAREDGSASDDDDGCRVARSASVSTGSCLQLLAGLALVLLSRKRRRE